MTWMQANVPNYATSKHGYWYTVNEPQLWHDYTKAAYLCNLAKTRAPGMKVMVSREAHPWIYDPAIQQLACGYDVWVGHINRIQTIRTWNRIADFGETSIPYFLDSDASCHVFGNGTSRCSTILEPFPCQVATYRNSDE